MLLPSDSNNKSSRVFVRIVGHHREAPPARPPARQVGRIGICANKCSRKRPSRVVGVAVGVGVVEVG
eukprot:9445156-Alexandrium_andersonii.AAC.1